MIGYIMKKEIKERSVKQINHSGNGSMVLITKEARALGMKDGEKVQVTAIQEGSKKYIKIEKISDLED